MSASDAAMAARAAFSAMRAARPMKRDSFLLIASASSLTSPRY